MASKGFIEVQPAYGRDYPNQREALAAWREGKDFTITEPGMVPGARYGAAVSIREADDLHVTLRYGRPKSGGPGLKVMTLQ